MTDVASFLDSVVPQALRDAGGNSNFLVVGSRAVSAYSCLAGSPEREWEVTYFGDAGEMKNFSARLADDLRSKGYDVSVTLGSSAHTLTVKLGQSDLSFMEVFLSSPGEEPGPYMSKDGINYGDLGFLMRELERKEDQAKDLVSRASELQPPEVATKMDRVKNLLHDNSVNLSVLEEEIDELEESLEGEYVPVLLGALEQCKKILVDVARDRDILFGAVLANRVDKSTMESVCTYCRQLEYQYNKWKGLGERCKDVEKMCSDF